MVKKLVTPCCGTCRRHARVEALLRSIRFSEMISSAVADNVTVLIRRSLDPRCSAYLNV